MRKQRAGHVITFWHFTTNTDHSLDLTGSRGSPVIKIRGRVIGVVAASLTDGVRYVAVRVRLRNSRYFDLGNLSVFLVNLRSAYGKVME